MTVENEHIAPHDRAIWFGPFCLRPAMQLLFEADKQVQIGVRTLNFLIALVERAGEVVTKNELFVRVWPGLTVDEGNLRTQMALLRKALRDGQAGARYVMTVPGSGYRFVAPVCTTDAPTPVLAPSSNPLGPSPVETASNLPVRLTRLIGRTEVLRDIIERLNSHRFITITGPGGIGKTSVALAAAERATSYDDGIHLVDYAPLSEPSSVPQKLASTLGLEISTNDPTRGLTAYLRNKRMLIVMDSCDRVVEATAILGEKLLKAAPAIGVLTTSREPLRAEGENVHRLSPLAFPLSSAGLTAKDALNYSAIQLFVERVTASLGQFRLRDTDAPVIAEICRRLDGIALAIELAAGRVDVFGLMGVAEQLKDPVSLLTRGLRTARPRHQTLAASLDWSYDALAKVEQAAFHRLSIFAGSFTLNAAEAVVADEWILATDIVEIVSILISKSLLNADVTTVIGQYRLLDTTRAYARKKLTESGEFDRISRRHAAFVQDKLERTNADVVTMSSNGVAARLSAESKLIDEARTSIDWAFSTGGDIECGIALTVLSIPLWTRLSLIDECRRYAEQALRAGKTHFGRSDRREMQLLTALGVALVWTKGPGLEADAAFSSALRIADSLGDSDYQIRAFWGLWSSHFNSGRIRLSLYTAQTFSVVSANHGDAAAMLVGERSVGMSLFYLGEHANARHHVESVLHHYVRPKDHSDLIRFQFDPRIVSRTLRAKLLWAQGYPDQAMYEVYGLVEEAKTVGHAMSLALALAQGACAVTLLSGDFTAAEGFVDLLLKHTTAHALDLWHDWAECFRAMLLIAHGSIDKGLKLLLGTLADLPQDAFFAYNAGIRATLADTLGKAGAIPTGFATIDEALVRSERDDERWYLAEFLRIKGELYRLEDTPRALRHAEEQFRRSLDCARRQEALSWELRTAISLARLYQGQKRVVEAKDVLAPVFSRFREGFQTADLEAASALLNAL